MQDLLTLKKEQEQLKRTYITMKVLKDGLEKDKERLEKEIEDCKVDDLKMYGIVMQKMAEKQRGAACAKLEYLGTCALQYAVSPNYKMEIDLKTGARPTADVWITKANGVKTDPSDDGNGGGIVDISSLGLRFISLESHEPAIDGPVVFDEPGKMVSKKYVPMLSEFMKKVGIDFDRQVILITHNDFLSEIADKKIYMDYDEKGNVSHVRVMTE